MSNVADVVVFDTAGGVVWLNELEWIDEGTVFCGCTGMSGE